MNIYPFIEAEKAGDHNVKRAYESLQVSRAAYYTAHRPTLCPGLCRRRADRADQGLHAQPKGRYGAPRIHAELRRNGKRHGKKRIARLMREAQIRGRTPRRWKKTTIPNPPRSLVRT